MDLYMIVLRAIHIASAVFWVGGTFFFLAVIAPTVQEAGAVGGQFMQRIAASGRLTARLTVSGILTTLSGLLMYWTVSGGLNGVWLKTAYGIVLTVGSIAGLLALGHAFFTSRPTSVRLGALAKGGTLAINAIYLSPIPEMDYDLIYNERTLRSVTASTRRDAEELLKLAGEIPIRTDVETFPLADANRALGLLKDSKIRGAGVLVVG